MLGFIFGFNARLGRLHYFLLTIALAVAMTGVCFVLARQVFQSAANGVPPSLDSIQGAVIAIGIVFAVISLILQSMRIRDIGWDPVCVIPAWFAVVIIDMLIARKFPDLSLGTEHAGTAVTAIVNLGLLVVTLFWPGAATNEDDYSPAEGDSWRINLTPRAATTSTAAERLARAGAGFARKPGW